jgi:predicted CXXCH cytochrome family protein
MIPQSHVADRKPRFTRGRLLAASVALLGAAALGLQFRTAALRAGRRHTSDLKEDAVERLPVPPAVSQDYAGSTVCRDCHREVWDHYQSHPMAHSFDRVLETPPIEDYGGESHFTRAGREYYVERSDAGVWHHERQADDDGATIYDQAVEVQYVLGSGKHGRSYIIDRNGLFFMSPITWYSQKRRWDLSPGYAERDHVRFDRPVVGRCLSCHVGRVAPSAEWFDHFREPAIVEHGIGCERCHGPARAHVAWQTATEPQEQIDPIVQLSGLNSGQYDSICNQCHLHGHDEILRFGRTDFDFRPGMQVGEVWSFLMFHQGDQTPKAVSQAEQMYGSICWQESAGRLTCVSCHDPHDSPGKAETDRFYREKCLTCHAVDDCGELPDRRHRTLMADSCVACHMPRLNASDVPHATQTDHRVLRRPGVVPATSRSAYATIDGNLEIFDWEWAPLSGPEILRIRGIVAAKKADQARNLQMVATARQYLELAWRAAPDDREIASHLATILFLDHNEAAAVDLWYGLLKSPPVNEETLQLLVMACQLLGRNSDALEHLNRLVEINPWQAEFWTRRAELQLSLGSREESLASGLKAIELDPSRVELYLRLAELADRLGNKEQGERLKKQGLRLKSRP